MTEEQKTYLKAAIMTGISMAGVGAFVRNWKAKKDRKKAQDIEKDRNVIVVPISKSDFIKDIPTPDERKRDMEGRIVGGLESNGGLGGFFDFFKKKASGENGDSPVEDSKKDDGTPVNEKKVTEEKIDGRTVLRGQDGRFVSQTDPVAAIDIEKSAGMGIWGSILHPIDFLESVGKESVKGPLMLTGGALGSIYLASKLVDIIGKNRRKNAKERQENARDAYITLLENGEGNEKKADVDLPKATGMVLGTSFFVPMALAAVVANKIIENRDADKKKKKRMANSYPDDPTFLYHVVDGEKIAMSADRALALMMFKTAMFSMCEDNEIEKRAQHGFGPIVGTVVKNSPLMYGAARAAGSIPGVGIKDDEAHKRILEMLGDEKNSARLLDVIRRSANGDRRGASAAISDLVYDNDPMLAGRLFASGYEEGPKRRGIENAIYSSPELSKIVAKRFTDENYKDTYGSFADEMIGKKLGLRHGSFLHKIVLWLMNMFGMRDNMIKGEIERQKEEMLSGLANKDIDSVEEKPVAVRKDEVGNSDQPAPKPAPNPAPKPAPKPAPNPAPNPAPKPAPNPAPKPAPNNNLSFVPSPENPGAAFNFPNKSVEIFSNPIGFWRSVGVLGDE